MNARRLRDEADDMQASITQTIYSIAHPTAFHEQLQVLPTIPTLPYLSPSRTWSVTKTMSTEQKDILVVNRQAKKKWKCETCGQLNIHTNIDCYLCGKSKIIKSNGTKIATLGIKLLPVLLDSIDVETINNVVLEKIAKGVQIFRPLSIGMTYVTSNNGKNNEEHNKDSSDKILLFNTLMSVQIFLRKCAHAQEQSPDNALETLIILSLALGDINSLLIVGSIFLGIDKEKHIKSKSLVLKLTVCFDQLVQQIATKKAMRKQTKEVSKWQCQVCGCLSQMSSQMCEMCAAARVESDDQVELHETKKPEDNLHVIHDSLKLVKVFKENVAKNHKENTYEDAGKLIFQLIDSLSIAYLMIDKDVGHNVFEPYIINLIPSTTSEKNNNSTKIIKSSISIFNLICNFFAIQGDQEEQEYVRHSNMNALPINFQNYIKNKDNKKTSHAIIMCCLHVAKVNIRRQTSIVKSQKQMSHIEEKINIAANKPTTHDTIATSLLGKVLMDAYNSATFANDDSLRSEILATRLELDKSQGLTKVIEMMLTYPTYLSLQVGGCRAIHDELQSAAITGGKINPRNPALMALHANGGKGARCLINATSIFWNDFAVLRPALTVLSQVPNILITPAAVSNDDGTGNNSICKLEDIWELMIKITRNVMQNEFLLLACIKILSWIVQPETNMKVCVTDERTRTTTNLVINALRNHLEPGIQECGITTLSHIASRQDPQLMWRFVRYMIDAGGVHTTVASIILLENRPSAKRLGLNLLTKCMVDESCFDDIPVPVALDCMKQNPHDSIMQVNGLTILLRLINITAKRRKFMRLNGLSVVHNAIAVQYPDVSAEQNEERVELAARLMKLYMVLSQDDERVKFGCNSHNDNKWMKMMPNVLISAYKKYDRNQEIIASLITCFLLAFRALVDEEESKSLIEKFGADVIVKIMNNTRDDLRMQQDCMWMLNYMANSTRDKIANAGGFASIVKSMKVWNQDEKVQLFGCIAIMNISGERGSGRGKKARVAGCEAAIKNACVFLEQRGDANKESLAAAKLAYKRMNKKCELM